MNMSVTENVLQSEKKIRFQSHAKVLFTNDNKIETLHRDDNLEQSIDEVDLPKKDKYPSLFSFLRVELTRGYVLEHDEERYSARREKVYSFMKIPREVEKFMVYGFMQCIDSFLYVYTFLPLRVFLAVWNIFTRPFVKCFGKGRPTYLSPAEACDVLKALVLIICSLLMFYVDTNIMYHLIKSQSVIKLYIFYNMLEVGDRLFSAFGQDVIDALFWTATEPKGRKREHLGVIPHLLFAVVYVFFHSMLVLCQATTLNVAINSNNKALLTIMISNNFVELKGSVFKKFDKNNLFQVSCSDVRERFHLVTLLFIVVMQTMKEYSWKLERFWIMMPDVVFVLTAEIFVDWIKHAFITRFNELHLDVYKDYTTSLAYDMAQTRQKHAFSDHSDLVARRMGFIPLPLGVVTIRVLVNAVHLPDIASIIIAMMAFMCASTLRVVISITTLGLACNLISQHKQEKAVPVQSPNAIRANSPFITSIKPFKDSATSPLKPVIAQPASNGIHNPTVTALEVEVPVEQLSAEYLGSAAIFSNSTVDLKTASLNEELLKANGDDINAEHMDLTKSDNAIKTDLPEVKSHNDLVALQESLTIKRRSDSEPNLVNCSEADE